MNHIKSFKVFENTDNKPLSELINTEIKIKRELVNSHGNKTSTIQGVISEIRGYSSVISNTYRVVVKDDNKTKASIMYDVDKDEFVESESSWHYVYTPLDEKTEGVFQKIKLAQIEAQ